MNVNTIQERSKILILNDCSLLNSGTNLRYLFQIDTLKSNIVLLLFFLGNQNSFWGVNSLVHFESQKVFNLYGVSAFDDVDDYGEMGICQNHLEFVSIGDTVDHVSNGASDSTEDGISLFLLKPHSELNGWVSFFVLVLDHFKRNVFESFCEGTQFTLDSD